MTYQSIDFDTNCVKVSTFLRRLGKKYPKFTKVWGEVIEYGCNTNDGYYHEVVEDNYVLGVDAETDGHFYVWYQARCKDQIIDGEGNIYNVSEPVEPVENTEPVGDVENAEPVGDVEMVEPDSVEESPVAEPVENAEPVNQDVKIMPKFKAVVKKHNGVDIECMGFIAFDNDITKAAKKARKLFRQGYSGYYRKGDGYIEIFRQENGCYVYDTACYL